MLSDVQLFFMCSWQWFAYVMSFLRHYWEIVPCFSIMCWYLVVLKDPQKFLCCQVELLPFIDNNFQTFGQVQCTGGWRWCSSKFVAANNNWKWSSLNSLILFPVSLMHFLPESHHFHISGRSSRVGVWLDTGIRLRIIKPEYWQSSIFQKALASSPMPKW